MPDGGGLVVWLTITTKNAFTRLFRINGLGGNFSHVIDPKVVTAIHISAKDLAA